MLSVSGGQPGGGQGSVAPAIKARDRLEAARLSVLAGCDEVALAALELEAVPGLDPGEREIAGALRDCSATLGEIAQLMRITAELLRQGPRP